MVDQTELIIRITAAEPSARLPVGWAGATAQQACQQVAELFGQLGGLNVELSGHVGRTKVNAARPPQSVTDGHSSP